MKEEEKSVPNLISDYLGKLHGRGDIAKFSELSDEYFKEIEHCHNTHFAQQESLNMTNKITGQRRTIEIEPKLAAIENLYREKTRDLASNLGYSEDEQEAPKEKEKEEKTDLTDDDLRQEEMDKFLLSKKLDGLIKQLSSKSKGRSWSKERG